MKKILNLCFEILKAALNVIMGALCFIKIDRDVALLPDGEGELKNIDRYYSVYDKLSDKNLQFLLYIALAIMVASVALSVVSCFTNDNKNIRIASHVAFAISLLLFVALLIFSMQFLQLSY